MRQKRNLDFYGGGISITEKEANECLAFVSGVIARVNDTILGKNVR